MDIARPSGHGVRRRPRRSPFAPAVLRAITARLLLLLALGAIGAATLFDGDPLALEPTGHLCLVCGSHGSIDVLLNVALFVPLGVALAACGVRWPVAVLVGLGVSAGVELAQLTVVTGRSPTLSDLLTNTTGTLVGAMLWGTRARWLAPDPSLARRLAAASAVAWTVIVTATALGLAPAGASEISVNQVRADDAFIREYEGTMLGWSLSASAPGAAPPTVLRGVEPPRLLDPTAEREPVDAAVARRLLAGDAIVARASVHAMLPPGKLRALVVVHDERGSPLLLLGHQGERAVLRQRTRSSELRFRSPVVALDGGFPPARAIPPGDDPARGPVVTVTGSADRDGLRVAVEDAAGGRAITMPRSPLVGWLLLAPQFLRYDARGPLLTALWVAGLLVPLAYWASFAAGPVRPGAVRRGAVRPGAVVALALLAALGLLAALPVLAAASFGGAARPRATEWATMALALAVGVVLAWAPRRRNAARNLAAAVPARQNTTP